MMELERTNGRGNSSQSRWEFTFKIIWVSKFTTSLIPRPPTVSDCLIPRPPTVTMVASFLDHQLLQWWPHSQTTNCYSDGLIPRPPTVTMVASFPDHQLLQWLPHSQTTNYYSDRLIPRPPTITPGGGDLFTLASCPQLLANKKQ